MVRLFRVHIRMKRRHRVRDGSYLKAFNREALRKPIHTSRTARTAMSQKLFLSALRHRNSPRICWRVRNSFILRMKQTNVC